MKKTINIPKTEISNDLSSEAAAIGIVRIVSRGTDQGIEFQLSCRDMDNPEHKDVYFCKVCPRGLL